ncbi:MAG: UDP-glucose 4-epimerase GalE [Firmicutes bacterium]|nr:UDP-glucose 4-epimerase GalE [Bacillota bacterium]
MKKIFVTGCTGYIGSHTCVELLNSDYEVIGLDNFSNSKKEVLAKIKKITGKNIKFYEGDMLDNVLLEQIFKENEIDAVIDFAAFKSVGDSVEKPIEYYINNVSSVLNLLSIMKKYNVKSLIFSSSATVYGEPEIVPITENCEVGGTTNPYGTSKLYVEGILKDLYKSDESWNICIFRYFNPVGAHPSGIIGEDPKGIPANLMPFITKVATKELDCLNVFGNDYDTFDGTGIRDYIHIVDLSKAHIKGLEKLTKEKKGFYIYNLGTGRGYSVLEMIETFEKVNNLKINKKIVERRLGDVAICYADPSLAMKELNWQAELTLEDMCKDAYNYVEQNMKN